MEEYKKEELKYFIRWLIRQPSKDVKHLFRSPITYMVILVVIAAYQTFIFGELSMSLFLLFGGMFIWYEWSRGYWRHEKKWKSREGYFLEKQPAVIKKGGYLQCPKCENVWKILETKPDEEVEIEE